MSKLHISNAAQKQFRARVTTGASREYLTKEKVGTLKIAVRQKAKNGLANERIRELIANYCHSLISHVHIIRGVHSPNKTIVVYGAYNNH